MSKVIQNINWALLNEQKEVLVSLVMGEPLTPYKLNAIDGIINLLDAIQDENEGVAFDGDFSNNCEK